MMSIPLKTCPKTALKCQKKQLLEIISSCCTQNNAKTISREQSNTRDREDDNARNPNQDNNNACDN